MITTALELPAYIPFRGLVNKVNYLFIMTASDKVYVLVVTILRASFLKDKTTYLTDIRNIWERVSNYSFVSL